jgi:hypothetical protein
MPAAGSGFRGGELGRRDMSRSAIRGLAAAAGAVALAVLAPAGAALAHEEPVPRPDWLAPFGGPHQGARHGWPAHGGHGMPGMMPQMHPPGATPWMPEMPQMPAMPPMGPGMAGPGMMGPGMMGPGMMGPGIGPAWLYGHPARPHAPIDEDHVRRMLEQRLAWHGNPRLEVGPVEAAEDGRIIAEVVTVDGSLVQRFAVDPASGMLWQIP